jgi:polar amino acid transport system substrate-binding protein
MKIIPRLCILTVLVYSTAVACLPRKETPTPTLAPPTPMPLAAVLPAPITPVPVHALGEILGSKMIVGTSANFSPWEYLDAQNNVAGFDIELMREIGRRGNIQVEFQDLQDFNALLPALQAGQVQSVIAAMRPNTERRKQADFTAFYHYTTQSIVTNPDLPIQLSDPKDIRHYALGVEKDTALDSWVIYELIKPGLLPLNNLNRYNNAAEIVDALRNTQILIGLLDSYTAVQYQNNNQVKILLTDQITPDGMAIAVKKDTPRLVEELNQIIEEMRGEGFISRLEATYLAPRQ